MTAHVRNTKCVCDVGPECVYCTLFICAVCKAGEGTLTTDCPGKPYGLEIEEAVYAGQVDYTDARGWHDKKGIGDVNKPEASWRIEGGENVTR